MPIQVWVSAVLAVLALVAAVWFYFALWRPAGRKIDQLDRHGRTVVARVLMAHESLYEREPTVLFEGAAVVFTRDNDASERHLAFLSEVCERLEDFEPDEDGDADEQVLGKQLATQTSKDLGAVRIPDRLTNGREVYFAGLFLNRRLLPKRRLTREYIYLKVLIDDQHRDVMMVEDPPPRIAKRRSGSEPQNGGNS